MEAKRVLIHQKTSFRRLTALLLVFAAVISLIPALSEPVQAAENGCWTWQFEKVWTQDNLYDGEDWVPVLITYEYNGNTYILDSTYYTGYRNNDDTLCKAFCELKGFRLDSDSVNDRVANGFYQLDYAYGGIPDTYDGDFPYGLWMKYAGKDGNNSNAKQYYLRESKDGTSIFYAAEERLADSARANGAYSSEKTDKFLSYLKGLFKDEHKAKVIKENNQWYTPFTILTGGMYGTSDDKVKLFSNVKGDDSSFYVTSGGNVGLTDDYSYNSSYEEFTMYVGKRVWNANVPSYGNMTVESDQEYVLTEKSAINMGDTVTVKKGATLIIKGNVYFNGTIENYGTIIVEDGTLQASHFINTGQEDTAYGCYRGYEGSSLIVLKNSAVMVGGDTTSSGYHYGQSGTGIELYGGAIINNGIISAPFGITLSGSAEIVNKSSGTLMIGYYFGNLRRIGYQYYDSFLNMLENGGASYATASWDSKSTVRYPVVVSVLWEGEKYPIIQNFGTIMANCGWINGNDFPLEDLTNDQLKLMLLEESSGSYQSTNNWTAFKASGKYYSWKNYKNVALW